MIVEASDRGVALFAPYFAGRRNSLARLYATYTTDELTVILDFLQRSTERLRNDVAALADGPDH